MFDAARAMGSEPRPGLLATAILSCLLLLSSCADERPSNGVVHAHAASAAGASEGDSEPLAVVLYGKCHVNVSAQAPRLVLGNGCAPSANRLLSEELGRIASLQGHAEPTLDDAETSRLLRILRDQYRNVRRAEFELEASKQSLEAARIVQKRMFTLLAQDLITRHALDAMAAEVHFAQDNVVEKTAAYRFAISDSPVDELEIYKARSQRLSYLATRSADAADDANDVFLRGRAAFATLSSAEMAEVRDRETLGAACDALLDQLEYVRTAATVSHKPLKLPTSAEMFQSAGCNVQKRILHSRLPGTTAASSPTQ